MKYIDDTDNKTLTTKDLSGNSDADSGYSTTSTIDGYKNHGYVLVSDSSNGQEIFFDHDDSKNQTYEVHLKHGTDSKNLTHDVKRTINYVHADSRKPIHDPYNYPLTFKETKVIDRVTGKVTSDTWSGPQNFPAVTPPTIPGYTPDKSSVPALTGITHNHQDITETVTYSPDAQKETVKFIDDTTGQTLATKQLTGYSDEDAHYNTKGDIANYKDQSYDLVSDSSNGQEIVFDHNDKTDQAYEVHLKHGTEQVTDHKTVTRMIHYVSPNGTPLHGETIQKVTFTRIGTKDKVTKQINWNPWTPTSQTMTAVVPPVTRPRLNWFPQKQLITRRLIW